MNLRVGESLRPGLKIAMMNEGASSMNTKGTHLTCLTPMPRIAFAPSMATQEQETEIAETLITRPMFCSMSSFTRVLTYLSAREGEIDYKEILEMSFATSVT